MNALQGMVEILQLGQLDATLVAPVHSRVTWEMHSAHHVRLDLKSQVVKRRPQAQTLVSVEAMLC